MGFYKVINNKLFLLVIFIFLLLGNIFFISKLLLKEDNSVNKYKYIDISRNFIAQDDFIVNLQPLRTKVGQLAKDFGEDIVSIYIEFLNTGANISVNKDNYIWPASLTKLPVAMAVMKKIENREWQMDSELVLMDGDANASSGDQDSMLAKNPIGTRFSIEELLMALLVDSDNTAYNILLRNLHVDELNQVKDEMGIDVLFNEEGRMSAKEYSRIFRSLYTSSFLERENSEKIMFWLDQSEFDNFLAGSLDSGIPFPHKYGENLLLSVYADSGIVYLPNRPYMLTVMVQGDLNRPSNEEKEKVANFMQVISGEVYKYFSQFK